MRSQFKKMMIPLLTVVFILFGYTIIFGQGTIRGKITDENGETIIGGSVTLKDNPTVGTITDFDGNYSLKLIEYTLQTIVVSYIGYNTMEFTVQAEDGEVVVRNLSMEPSTELIEEVQIVTKALKSNDYYMERMKQKSATTIDYISSETMSATGDANVISAVERVSGVSTFGGLITVRGIGDRYIKTTINRSVIPTLDPFTNNIKLDLFPSKLIDNVVITKTASADLPGDWAGAYISVLTKDYPDRLSISTGFSVGYNSHATFEEVLTSDRSSTDWLGFDNGLRDIDHDKFIEVNPDPSKYEELVALGLEPYYSSLGVTSGWLPGSNIGDVYFKLALVQLGLLGPALFNNMEAVTLAKETYEEEYSGEAFVSINQEAAESNQALPNNWNTYTRQALPDFSHHLSIGNQVNVFGKPLGFIVGYRYESKWRYDPQSKTNVASVDANGDPIIASSSTRQFSKEIHGWSALINLAYKLNSNNSVSILFMPNLRGVNNVQDVANRKASETYELLLRKNQFYEERKQLVYQYKSEHYIPSTKMKFEANASFTDGSSSAPDFKYLTYFADNDGQYIIDETESDTYRYYRYLKEDLFDSQLSLEFPFMEKAGIHRKLKLGGAYQKKNRDYDQYEYRVVYNSSENEVKDNDFENFFDLDRFGISEDFDIDLYYDESGNPANHTIGFREVIGGFAMVDYTISPVIRISGGLRVEKANIFADVYEYNILGLPKSDPRRQFPGEIFTVNPAHLNELSYLPSTNIIYTLKDDEKALMNLRFNYSRTVARPSIRELTDVVVYDFELRNFVFGNSDLEMVKVHNFDFRFENYFNGGHGISLSAFYKDFKDHIELVNTNQGFTWQNVDESRVLGLELEGKVEIKKDLEIKANATVVNSQTEFVRSRLLVDDGIKTYVPIDTISRSMFGQAPYIVNGIVTYKSSKLSLSASVSYNLQGPKLILTSVIKGVPDIFELPRHQLDVKVSKSLDRKKHFDVSFKAQNVLNEPTRRSYKYDNGDIIDFDTFSPGITYEIGFSYEL